MAKWSFAFGELWLDGESVCELGNATPTSAAKIVAALKACEGINPEAVPLLLEACQMEAYDNMDGDLLSMVAESLLSRAESLEARGHVIRPAVLRKWADKLQRKQAAQAAALAKAKGE